MSCRKMTNLPFRKITLMGLWIMNWKEKEPEAGRPVERGAKELVRA